MTIRNNDLVTLSEAAGIIGIGRSVLFKRLQRGTLTVRPALIGRTTVLYSLAELQELYPSRDAANVA